MREKTLLYCVALLLAVFFYADQAFSLTLYVNPMTGRDVPFRGRSLERPLKTIGYSLSLINEDSKIQLASGIYNETLVIEKLLSVQLVGIAPENTIIRGDGSNPTIKIVGPNRIKLENITVENGTNGVWSKFSYITFNNVFVQNNSSHGIYAKGNSHLDIENSTIKSNLAYGVRIHSGSSAQLTKCDLGQNTSSGLQATYNSFADISESTVHENSGGGVMAAQNSSVSLTGNEIRSNKQSGLDITGHSQAGLWGGNKIYDNADDSGWRAGVAAYFGSQITIIPSSDSDKDEIYGNHGPGVHLTNSSVLFLKSGIVRDNYGNGVGLHADSTAQFETGAAIKNNNGFGVNCMDQLGDSKYLGVYGFPILVSDNIMGDINCYHY